MDDVTIPFPMKGKDENWAMGGQPPLTSPDLQNVRPRDVQDKRSRGGQRPGVRKVMYWWDSPDGEDLGLPDPTPVIGLAQVTAVYYASVAGESTTSYEDPTGGDPRWDGLAFYMKYNPANPIQLYSFTGNILGTAEDGGGGNEGRVAIDKVGNIFVAESGYQLRKYYRDGTKLAGNGYSSGSGGIFPSIKNDNVVFCGYNYSLWIYQTEGFDYPDNFITSENFGQGNIWDMVQLENSNDILITFSGSHSTSVKRVDRVDLSDVTNYTALSSGAMSIAVDEENGWLYKVGGAVTAAEETVYRCDLSDGGDVQSYNIPGADLQFVRLYGGKVYACGARATDNNTIWKLDADLTTVEADYDTGAQVNQMRILGNGIIYAVGEDGTNEDTETGNVNVLSSDLVQTDTWSVLSGQTITSVGEKWG